MGWPLVPGSRVREQSFNGPRGEESLYLEGALVARNQVGSFPSTISSNVLLLVTGT